MAYEQRDNSGSLLKNDKKESDKHPNAKGTAKIDGVEYWMDAWTKKDKNGNPWQSVSFKRKEHRQDPAPPPAREPIRRQPGDDDSDIPF